MGTLVANIFHLQYHLFTGILDYWGSYFWHLQTVFEDDIRNNIEGIIEELVEEGISEAVVINKFSTNNHMISTIF